MGEVMIAALIKNGVEPESIQVGEIDRERIEFLSEKYRVRCFESNFEAIKGSDVVVLSIKPPSLPEIAPEIGGKLESGQLLLSIIAGITLQCLKESIGHELIVRAMPNTPARIGEGMTLWTATPEVARPQKEMARTVLEALGKEIYVEEEKYLDMATALSGSGPAYVFLIIEALIDAGVYLGLPREMARELVLQTSHGALKLCRESGRHPAELKDMVTSPGGTTAAALLQLEEGGIRGMLAQAVIAAYEKAKALSGSGK